MRRNSPIAVVSSAAADVSRQTDRVDLAATDLFRDLPADDLRRVAALAREERFPEGGVVVEEGRKANAFYVVVEGEAIVSVRGRTAAVRRQGQWFGESALVDDERRHATVSAATDLTVLAWPGETLREVLARNPAALQHVFDEIRRRSQDLFQRD